MLVRTTVGVEAHTHEFIATAHEDQKFGFSLAGGDALEAVRRVLRGAGAASCVGLHSHIGSQIFDTGGFEVAAHRVVGLLALVRDEVDVELAELNLGGGLGIAYPAPTTRRRRGRWRRTLRGIVDARVRGVRPDACRRWRSSRAGRIVGPGTVTLYEVGTVKP